MILLSHPRACRPSSGPTTNWFRELSWPKLNNFSLSGLTFDGFVFLGQLSGIQQMPALGEGTAGRHRAAAASARPYQFMETHGASTAGSADVKSLK